MIELEKHTSLISYLKQRYIIYYNCFLRMFMLFTYLKHLAYNISFDLSVDFWSNNHSTTTGHQRHRRTHGKFVNYYCLSR